MTENIKEQNKHISTNLDQQEAHPISIGLEFVPERSEWIYK